jgi:uncharacterized iron-regulated membrane protein
MQKALSGRRLLFLVHQYTGFIFAAYLIVICASGAALVLLENQIDGYRDYLMLRVPVQEHKLSIGEVYAIAVRAHPEKPYRHILLSCPNGCTYDVSFDDGSNRLDVLVDPYSGAILKTIVWEHTAIGRLYGLHGSLFLGDTGETINSVAGLSFIVLGCTGLLLWRGRFLRRLSVYNLHRIVGVSAVAFLLMWALTAAGQTFWNEPPEPIPDMRPTNGVKALSLDRAIAIGDAALPGELTFVSNANGGLVVRKRVPGDPDPYGYSYVAVDDAGRVRQVYDVRTFSLAWRVRAALYAVHIGAPGGPMLRALYALMGLAPAALFLTAFLMWLGRLKRVL